MSSSKSNINYRNAPIIEAIIDIQVRHDSPPPLALFDLFYENISKQFPNKQPINVFEMGVEIGPENINEQKTKFSQTELGYRLTNLDDSRVLQVQQKGFTYSHMAPYSNWSKFVAEAKILWDDFYDKTKPIALTRCAVRFINKLDIPGEVVEASDYFHLYPKMPKNIGSANGMFMQIQLPQDDISKNNAAAVLNFGLQNDSKVFSFFLDFDVFQMVNSDEGFSEIWEILEKLRNRKNELFESCITDKTKELIS